jgi:hypothetical protein
VPLDATSFENGYPTTEELLYSAAKKESVTAVQRAFCTQIHLTGWFRMKLCVKCTSHSCHRLFLHCLQNTSTPLLWDSHFQKDLMASRGAPNNNNNHLGHLKKTYRVFLSTGFLSNLYQRFFLLTIISTVGLTQLPVPWVWGPSGQIVRLTSMSCQNAWNSTSTLALCLYVMVLGTEISLPGCIILLWYLHNCI